MPIIRVEIVAPPDEPLPDRLAARLADGLAALWASPPQGTWVHVSVLDVHHYAENDGGPLPGVAPVFVTVLQARLAAPQQLRTEASAIAGIVAACCARPMEQIHVIFEPPAAGRIAFGGELLEDS